jgi:4-hydroxyphenylacetate 3-hydroxylase, reductase component
MYNPRAESGIFQVPQNQPPECPIGLNCFLKTGKKMPIDPARFRKALGCFATGVTVVTAGKGPQAAGITVSSFASVSLEPPLVLWCLNRTSQRYATFTTAENFTISVLGAAQQALAGRLAEPGQASLAGLELIATESGVPAICGALAVLECARETVHELGDHAVVVGRVLRFSWNETDKPLVYFRGRYAKLA